MDIEVNNNNMEFISDILENNWKNYKIVLKYYNLDKLLCAAENIKVDKKDTILKILNDMHIVDIIKGVNTNTAFYTLVAHKIFTVLDFDNYTDNMGTKGELNTLLDCILVTNSYSELFKVLQKLTPYHVFKYIEHKQSDYIFMRTMRRLFRDNNLDIDKILEDGKNEVREYLSYR